MAASSATQIFSIFLKEIKSEFRTRYAISAIILFVLTTITMIAFSIAGLTIEKALYAGVLWVIMFFASMTGLSKSFVSEEERGTVLLLQLSASSTGIFFGKLLFNLILSITLNIMAAILFMLFSPGLDILSPMIFWLVIIFGSVGLASATTIISAIIAKANSRNALFPVLSFPILIPLILTGIEATVMAFEGKPFSDISGNFQLMLAYSGVLITVSYLVFDLVWKD